MLFDKCLGEFHHVVSQQTDTTPIISRRVITNESKIHEWQWRAARSQRGALFNQTITKRGTQATAGIQPIVPIDHINSRVVHA